MKPRHKRFAMLGGLVATVGVIVALVLNAFQSNLVFFYSPSQVSANEAPVGRTFRVGGLVEAGSVKVDGTQVQFVVTDTATPAVLRGPDPDPATLTHRALPNRAGPNRDVATLVIWPTRSLLESTIAGPGPSPHT